jgi:hypothetical protein
VYPPLAQNTIIHDLHQLLNIPIDYKKKQKETLSSAASEITRIVMSVGIPKVWLSLNPSWMNLLTFF